MPTNHETVRYDIHINHELFVRKCKHVRCMAYNWMAPWKKRTSRYISFFPPITEIVMHDAYIGGRFRWTRITGKVSDAAENLQLYRVVWFFHPRPSRTTTHMSADVQRIILNASCSTILCGRTKQLHIFCRVTGFTSDFLSFIVVELMLLH